MSLQGPKTAEWFDRGKAALVNGVSSGFRYWGDDDTLVIDRGEGAYVYDMDGKRYIDYQLGFGPIILGHGYKPVADAVAAAAARGTVFAMTTALEIEAAEAVRDAVPWLDELRFTNTGTEATMHAIRLARAVTGRDLIVKFEGAYHGAHDYVGYSTAGSPIGYLGNRRSPFPSRSLPAFHRRSVTTSGSPTSTTSRSWRSSSRATATGSQPSLSNRPSATSSASCRTTGTLKDFGRSPKSGARCSSSTRSRPGSVSDWAEQPNTSTSSPTSAHTRSRWATGSRLPRLVAEARSCQHGPRVVSCRQGPIRATRSVLRRRRSRSPNSPP